MTTSIEEFLKPLNVDVEKIHRLAKSLRDTYLKLAAESTNQFLATPISESVLRPDVDEEVCGKYLAIDIGGTNLRVGFIELLSSTETENAQALTGPSQNGSEEPEASRVKRHLEKAWPIGEQLKNDKAEDLFEWIGTRIAEVVSAGVATWPGELPQELPMGVTFSFPMIQNTISEAILMPMGKGFAITSKLDLSEQLRLGYETARTQNLPTIKIVAIVNDSVATLVSFAYQYNKTPKSKASMGLIVGTGCNATIPLSLSKLLPSKRPSRLNITEEATEPEDVKIAVNTEWSIKGSVYPLKELDFITEWDSKLDEEGGYAGFMPFEFMTAGKYLGELGRIIAIEYFTDLLSIPHTDLPSKLQQRHGLTTSFLGNLGPHLSVSEPLLLKQLMSEFPCTDTPTAWQWTPGAASALLAIAKAIQRRAAGMVAGAIIGLLACADELPLSPSVSSPNGTCNGQATIPAEVRELMVGYTGGCIVHFQDYLADCQDFLDAVMRAEFGDGGGEEAPRVVLKPCHNGGIIGAGILAGTVSAIAHDAGVSSA